MYRFLRGSSIAFAAAACLAVPVSLSGDDITFQRDVTVKIPPATVTQDVVAPKPTPTVSGDTVQPEAAAPAVAVPAVTSVAADTVDVSLAGPASVGGGDFVIVAIASATAGADLTFTYDPDPGATKRAVFEEPGTGRRLIVFIQPPANRYRIALIGQIASEGRDPFDVAVHDVVVGNVPPPTPPGPTPPTPPEPTPPTPDTAPFPADGLHVLVVYESSKMNSLTEDQRAIIQGVDVRSALNAAAPGRYRIYDQNADLTHVPQVWKDAMAVKRDSLPWVAMSNGKTGFSGPLDMTAEEFKQLLAEFK